MIAGPASDHHQAPSSTWQLHPILMLYLFSPKKKVFLVEILSTAFNISHQIVQFLISQIFHRGLTVILCFWQIFRMIPVVNMFKSKLANIKQSVPTSAHRSLIIARLQLKAGVLELQHQGRLLPPALVDCPTQLTFLGFGILVTNPKVEIWKTHQMWLQRNRKTFGRKTKKHNWMGQAHFARAK